MPFVQGDLDKIDAAIASGVRKVTFADGRSKEYQNLDQMLAARDVISGSVAGPVNTAARRKRRLIIGRVGRW